MLESFSNYRGHTENLVVVIASIAIENHLLCNFCRLSGMN